MVSPAPRASMAPPSSPSVPPATPPATPRQVSPWNPANAVTASRFLTLPIFLWAVANGAYQYAGAAIVLCGLLDKVDGLVAKVFDCRSAFGELFDAITDAICYGFCLTVVVAYGWAPWQPVVIGLGLGVVNTAMRAVYGWRAKRPTNYKSYAMERIVAFTAYLIGFATIRYEVAYFYWTFVATMAVVVIHDGKRMLLDPVPPAPASVPAAARRS